MLDSNLCAGVELDILAILWEDPRPGAEILRAMEQRHGSPAVPGTVYPTLQLLEARDFVAARVVAGRRVYAIADKGSAFLADNFPPE